MYFNDRMSLGDKLADNLIDIKGTDAIIVSLKQSSMMVSIAMAIKLRAWILPLFYEPLVNPLDRTKLLGALTQNGDFCLHPDITTSEYDYIVQEFMSTIEQEKRSAMSRLNKVMNQHHGVTDPHVLNGRNVILVGDVMMHGLELKIAKHMMKPLRPARVYGMVGNTTIEVSEAFHLSTDQSHVLDILPTSFMGEDHYFEAADAYSHDEKQSLAINIAQYWA